jgi:hypothetical protein
MGDSMEEDAAQQHLIMTILGPIDPTGDGDLNGCSLASEHLFRNPACLLPPAKGPGIRNAALTLDIRGECFPTSIDACSFLIRNIFKLLC